MTSEPDSTPKRRPPTIDLTATEIEPEKPAASEASATNRDRGGDGDKATATARSGHKLAGWLPGLAVGAGAGILVVGAFALGAWYAGFVSPRAGNPGMTSLVRPSADSGQISARLDKVQAELEALQRQSRQFARLAALEAQTKALSDSVATLTRRLDVVSASAKSALGRANAAILSAKAAAQGTVPPNGLNALTGRVVSLEREVAALSKNASRAAAGAQDRPARLVLATAALRAALERGEPYQTELGLVTSYGVDAQAVAALKPYAATGIPTAQALAHELSSLLPALAKASLGRSKSGSLLTDLENDAKNLVHISPVGVPAGSEPVDVLARISVDAAQVHIAAALADLAQLPPSAKTLAQPWMRKAEARAAAVAASRRIGAVALQRLESAHGQ
jgi:hypothetical protein